MQNELDPTDVREDLVFKLIKIQNRLSFFCKLQQIKGETFTDEEMIYTFESFKDEKERIIDTLNTVL